jgi:multiple antibiotic resistance protein
MNAVSAELVPFLAILNPFALCLYLQGVMEDLDTAQFVRVLGLASIISLAVFWVFALGGETVLIDLFNLRIEALRVFGGMIFFVVGYNYATRGFRATEMLRGNLDDLPSAIALPFMIGAGTITQAILLGKRHDALMSLSLLFLAVAISFAVVITFHFVRERLRKKYQAVFDRYVNIFSRLNGLLIGAISVQMVVTGVRRIWTQGPGI